MANLKLDLINKVGNEKYYEEIEFIRLAQEPSMNYAAKIALMAESLERIAVLNALPALVEHYLPEQPQQAAPAPEQEAPQAAPAPEVAQEAVPAPKVQPRQSHGEG